MLPRLRKKNIEGFPLFVHMIFESSDICASFGMHIEDRELVWSRFQREGIENSVINRKRGIVEQKV